MLFLFYVSLCILIPTLSHNQLLEEKSNGFNSIIIYVSVFLGTSQEVDAVTPSTFTIINMFIATVLLLWNSLSFPPRSLFGATEVLCC